MKSTSSQTAIGLVMAPRQWGMLILLAFLWGGAFFFVKVSIAELPTMMIVFCRVGLAALVLVAFVLMTGRTIPKSPNIWLAFFIMGFLNNVVPFSLIVWGQKSITSGLASILNGTTPIFTMLVAGLLLADERLSLNKVMGVVLGLLGIVAISGVDALSGLSNSLWAQLAILGAALSYGFAAVHARRFRAMGVDPVVGAMGQVCASSLLLLPIMIWDDWAGVSTLPSFWVILSVVLLAVLSTAWAYILYFRLLDEAGATNASLVTLLIPVFAILLGVLILGESMKLSHILGMILIGFGLLVVDGRALNYLRSKKPSETASLRE